MEFRDLKRQYQYCKDEIDSAIAEILQKTNFISGEQVVKLENELAEYVGRKYCISCANGTDALQLALMAMGVGSGDAIFVPDFTFFATAEVVSLCKATPVFVDIQEDTFNMNPQALEMAIQRVLEEGKLVPRVVIAVDLFGLPADYDKIGKVVEKYSLSLIEDGAQGFGGSMNGRRACSFGAISTTSFFPAKPLGCYGDGGALFTDNDELTEIIRSLRIHGKGQDKYDNVRIGLNSRLDTIQANILRVKLDVFLREELERVNQVAKQYSSRLRDYVKVPDIEAGFYSSWAQYCILLENENVRDGLIEFLKNKGIPSMVYYKKPMHEQRAFFNDLCVKTDCSVTEQVCKRILALPMHPYLDKSEVSDVANAIIEFVNR